MKPRVPTRIIAGRDLGNDFMLLMEDIKQQGVDTDGLLQAIAKDNPSAVAAIVIQSPALLADLGDPSRSAIGPFLAMWAAGWNAVGSVQWLEDHGVDSDGNPPAQRPEFGRIAWEYRPIEEAVSHNAIAVIDHLVDRYGSDILLRPNKAGVPPLFKALAQESTAAALRILELLPQTADQRVGEWILEKGAEQHLIQEGKPHMATWLQSWKSARAARAAIAELEDAFVSAPANTKYQGIR